MLSNIQAAVLYGDTRKRLRIDSFWHLKITTFKSTLFINVYETHYCTPLIGLSEARYIWQGELTVNWNEVIHVTGFILVLIYLIFGLDDTIWFICAFINGLLRKRKAKDDVLSFDVLRKTPPKMLAVAIASWHEANVIVDMIVNFLNTTDYPKSMYHVFIGVYPNDPDTIAAVNEASKIYPNVHAIINCVNGPTTKAQNINHMIREIRNFEQEKQIRFASLTVHDSEDVVHTYELLATNYLVEQHDAMQFPVFPIIEMPRFSNFFRQMTTATYADEFAESHYLSLVQRKNMNAFVPCAGTGFTLSRKCIEQFGDEDVLPSESLTEDYLLSLILYKKGIPLHYVLNRLPRVMKNGRVRTDFITTRALFPSTFRAAVRQKTRWTYGITMQSVHLRDVFQSRGVSLAGRYSFYKDLKAKVLNLIPMFGYLVSIYCIASMFFHLEPMYEQNSPVMIMAVIVFVISILRQILRGYSLYHVYGFRSMFFGVLLPPLFPIRLIYGNIINFTATVRAFWQRFTSRPKVNSNHDYHSKAHRKAKKTVKWAKTDHSFLTKDQLRSYRRMLGDTLIAQGDATPDQVSDALQHMDKDHGQHIGNYLVEQGVITEEQMIQALSHVKHIQFIPDQIAAKLDYEDALKQFDLEKLKKLNILPLSFSGNLWYIGVCDLTTDENLQAFQAMCGSDICRMYLTAHFLEETFRAMETDADSNPSRHTKLSSLTAYHMGFISYEQAVLIGIYADINQCSEDQMRKKMGLAYQLPAESVSCEESVLKLNKNVSAPVTA